MERYGSIKPPVKKYFAWHAPTIKNVCKLEFRMERLEEECAKVRRIFSNAPELAALYAEMKGSIPGFFAPRPPTGKPSLVVDNTRAQRSRSLPARPRPRGIRFR
jgi:hypothetical protein